MQLLKCVYLLFGLFVLAPALFAQPAPADSVIAKVARRFEEVQHLSLQKIIKPAAPMQDAALPCYSGMQVTVVAVFEQEPLLSFGRMLVTKRYATNTQYDEHFFQQAGYDETLKVHYSLLSVYFPPNATLQNCNTLLQVYDKQAAANKVWLIVLTK